MVILLAKVLQHKYKFRGTIRNTRRWMVLTGVSTEFALIHSKFWISNFRPPPDLGPQAIRRDFLDHCLPSFINTFMTILSPPQASMPSNVCPTLSTYSMFFSVFAAHTYNILGTFSALATTTLRWSCHCGVWPPI